MSTDVSPLFWCGWTASLPPVFLPSLCVGNHRDGEMELRGPNGAISLRWKARGEKKRWWEQDSVGCELPPAMVKNRKDRFRRLDRTPHAAFRDAFAGAGDGWSAGAAISHDSKRTVHMMICGPEAQAKGAHFFAGLAEQSSGESLRWALFGNEFTTLAGWELERLELNLGDSRFFFRRASGKGFFAPTERMGVRFLAPGRLALDRQPLDTWLRQDLQEWKNWGRRPVIHDVDETRVESRLRLWRGLSLLGQGQWNQALNRLEIWSGRLRASDSPVSFHPSDEIYEQNPSHPSARERDHLAARRPA